MSASRIRAVLFDAAGVLSEPFGLELVADALAAGADPLILHDTLFPIFASAGDGDSIGNRLERGEATLEEFFSSLGPDAVHCRLVADPAAATFFGHRWKPNREMHAFVRELAEAGYAVGLISNNVREWQEAWDRIAPAELPFAARVFSWEVGARKPEPEIYLTALDRLGVDPAEAVFLDDFPAMAEGARRVGMAAIDVTDTATAIAETRELLSHWATN